MFCIGYNQDSCSQYVQWFKIINLSYSLTFIVVCFKRMMAKPLIASRVWPPQCFRLTHKLISWMKKKLWEELIAYISWYDTDNKENGASNNFSICWVCVRCRGNVSTEPLPSNDRRTHINIQANRRDLWSTPLRWVHVPWYAYQVSYRLVQPFKSW
jgi:hypothetical protein